MQYSIDGTHTKVYYEYIERLYQLEAFYTYIDPKIKEYSNLSRSLMSLPIHKEDINIVLKKYEIHRVTQFKPFFINLLYIFIIMTMDNYFNDLLRIIYNYRIECLKNNQKNYTREEILNYDDYEALKNKMIEDEIFGFDMKRDYKKKIQYFENKFNIDLLRIKENENKIIELCELRNIIIHNNGKINEKFLEKVNNDSYSLGEEVVIDYARIHNAVIKIQFVLSIIDDEMMSKFFK